LLWAFGGINMLYSMQRQRIRITIRSLQVAVLLVAVLLSVRLYIEPRLYWRDLWILLFAVAFHVTFLWLVLWAPRSARLAALAFVVGVVVEFDALNYFVSHGLIRRTPGRWTPEGWYPLALPAERILITRGWAAVSESSMPGMFIGMALSGVAACIMMLIAWSLWRAMSQQEAATAPCFRDGS
jgi:hypothetical protein